MQIKDWQSKTYAWSVILALQVDYFEEKGEMHYTYSPTEYSTGLKLGTQGSALDRDLSLAYFNVYYNLLCYVHSSLLLFFAVHNFY